MKTIYKYTLGEAGDAMIEVALPRGSKIVHCANQRDNDICIWALVDTQRPTEIRRFRIVGTGHEIHPRAPVTHIGTVAIAPFVWHVLEDLTSAQGDDE